MRASDDARERTAALLRRRWGEGYLSLETFERRVADVYRARSAEQLAGLTADLPAVGLLARLRQWRLGTPEGLRLPLQLVRDRPLTLGRGQTCDVVVAHDTVSRRHAEISREAGGCYVSDLGSTNGTWIDGRRVDGVEPVRCGDQMLLGGCLVVLV
jgi:hypothetical protein